MVNGNFSCVNDIFVLYERKVFFFWLMEIKKGNYYIIVGGLIILFDS